MNIQSDISARRKKYTKYNILMSCVLQLANIIIGLVLPRLLINEYGSEVNGLVSWVTQIFNFFQLLEGGVSVAAAVALYKPFADGDEKKINGIFRAIGKYYMKSGELLLGLSVVSSVVFMFMFRKSLPGTAMPELTILAIVMISGVTNALNFLLLGKFNVVCDADQHTFVLHVFTLTAKMIVFLLQCLMVLLRVHIIIVMLPNLLLTVIRLALTYLFVKKRYPYLLEAKKCPEIGFEQKNDALIIQIANLLKRNAPMIVLGVFGELGLLSIYNIYASIFHASSSLLEMASQSLTSNFGNLAVTEDKKKVANVYRRSEWLMTALLSVIMVCYMRLTVPFMAVYSRGFDIEYVFPVMAVLFTAAEFAANLGVLPRMAAISCGYIRESRNPAIIEAACALLVGIAGYLLFGLNGLMIGCIIGSIIRTGYHIWLISSKVVKDKFTESFYILAVNLILIAVSLTATHFTDKLFGKAGIIPENAEGMLGYALWALIAVADFVISVIIVFGGNVFARKTYSMFRRNDNCRSST